MRKAVLLLALAALTCSSEPPRPLNETELALILTASSFTKWGMPDLDARNQTIETRSNLDGSMTIKCSYDSDKTPNSKQPLYFVSEVRIYSSAIGLEDEIKKLVDAVKIGVSRVPNRTVHESQGLLTSGDQHYAGTMYNGNNPIGNIFAVRRGRVIHSLIMSRIYFDDPKDVARLFAPMYAASDKYLGADK